MYYKLKKPMLSLFQPKGINGHNNVLHTATNYQMHQFPNLYNQIPPLALLR